MRRLKSTMLEIDNMGVELKREMLFLLMKDKTMKVTCKIGNLYRLVEFDPQGNQTNTIMFCSGDWVKKALASGKIRIK